MNSPDSSSLNVGALEMAEMEPSRPWRPLVVPAVIVIVLLGIAWALFAHYGRSKLEASGAVLKEQVYPVQVDGGTSQPEAGMQGSVPEQDEMIVLVQARVTNVSKKPLAVFDMVSDVNLDGNTNQSFAAQPEDIDRLFQRFPDLMAMKMPLLTRHQIIQPGQSAEGLMIFNYAWSQQQWDQRKKPHVVVSFFEGHPLTLQLQ